MGTMIEDTQNTPFRKHIQQKRYPNPNCPNLKVPAARTLRLLPWPRVMKYPHSGLKGWTGICCDQDVWSVQTMQETSWKHLMNCRNLEDSYQSSAFRTRFRCSSYLTKWGWSGSMRAGNQNPYKCQNMLENLGNDRVLRKSRDWVKMTYFDFDLDSLQVRWGTCEINISIIL